MNKPMSPSKITTITSGQIGKFLELQAAALRKSGLPSEPTQNILETQGAALADEFVKSVRERVEAVSNLVVRHIKVDRNRSRKQVIDATGRRQYVTDSVLAGMPRGEGDEKDVYFFRPRKSVYKNGLISDDKLAEEYEFNGLKPDPYAVSAVNEADPAFADEHPNGTHWKDANGNWCYAAFSRWLDERNVDVNRNDRDWSDSWSFGGVRK